VGTVVGSKGLEGSRGLYYRPPRAVPVASGHWTRKGGPVTEEEKGDVARGRSARVMECARKAQNVLGLIGSETIEEREGLPVAQYLQVVTQLVCSAAGFPGRAEDPDPGKIVSSRGGMSFATLTRPPWEAPIEPHSQGSGGWTIGSSSVVHGAALERAAGRVGRGRAARRRLPGERAATPRLIASRPIH
jgi:hypothetical protein